MVDDKTAETRKLNETQLQDASAIIAYQYLAKRGERANIEVAVTSMLDHNKVPGRGRLPVGFRMAVFACQQSNGGALSGFAAQIGSIVEMTIRHFRDQSEIPTEQQIKKWIAQQGVTALQKAFVGWRRDQQQRRETANSPEPPPSRTTSHS